MPIEGRPSPPPLRFTLVLIVSILIIAHLILEKALEVAFEQPPRVEKHQSNLRVNLSVWFNRH